MKIFIAGATGVNGLRCIPLLLAGGHDVAGAVRSQSKAEELLRVGAKPLHIDLFDRDTVMRTVSGFDAVINLAPYSTILTSIFCKRMVRK